MPDRLRILLVDDHFLLRAGLSSLLEPEPDMEVCGEADTGRQGIALCESLRPDVTIMDLRLPDMSGVEATATIRRTMPDARIIILTNYGGDEEIYSALQAGASSYLLKTVRRDELLAAVRTVAGGRPYVSPEVATRLVERLPRSELSLRELEVLTLVAQGRRNHEIAATLGISEITVKHHVSHILSKLAVSDRTGAVAAAISRGIIRLE